MMVRLARSELGSLGVCGMLRCLAAMEIVVDCRVLSSVLG